MVSAREYLELLSEESELEDLAKEVQRSFGEWGYKPIKAITGGGREGLDIAGYLVGVHRSGSGYVFKMQGRQFRSIEDLVNYFWDRVL